MLNQERAGTNQIKSVKKDRIQSDINLLTSYCANSTNGGIVKPFFYKIVLPHEQHLEFKLSGRIRIKTQLVPAMQPLRATIKAYFVPFTRVWKNADKFLSQKGGSTQTKISTIPNMGGQYFSAKKFTDTSNVDHYIQDSDTEMWRDSWRSSYIPRVNCGYDYSSTVGNPTPPISILALRGFKAIYNDFERNKQYDTEFTEYDQDTAQNIELHQIVGTAAGQDLTDLYQCRGKRANSYYTDYRTELLGKDPAAPVLTSTTGDLIVWKEWEKQVEYYRQQSENSELTDYMVISKMYGSKQLSEGKVQLLGEKTITLNYGAVTQSAYNTNSSVRPEFQVMGTQGAYSYTEFEIPLYHAIDFKEAGIIHLIMQVSADSIFETGLERTMLNITPESYPQPDLIEQKNDVLYNCEKNTNYNMTTTDFNKIDGYKRKWNEFFKMPCIIGGDMMTTGYVDSEINNKIIKPKGATLSQTENYYNFTELDDAYTSAPNGLSPTTPHRKKIWKDYTDILLNNNSAIKQTEEQITIGSDYDIHIKGNNQILFAMIPEIRAILPINQDIKENAKKFGEE